MYFTSVFQPSSFEPALLLPVRGNPKSHPQGLLVSNTVAQGDQAGPRNHLVVHPLHRVEVEKAQLGPGASVDVSYHRLLSGIANIQLL